MKIKQLVFHKEAWTASKVSANFPDNQAQLVLVFGERKLLEQNTHYDFLHHEFPNADIVINSTSGEIHNDSVHDNTIVATAIAFEKTKVRTLEVDIKNHIESYQAGAKIANDLLEENNLKAIMIISDGSKVNGTKLTQALNEITSYKVQITGGLAGDQARFQKTLVGLNGNPEEGKIIGIGFYGDDITIGHGTQGGWDAFGPEREITKSEYNVLYSIDNKPALDLYKEYLGSYAAELPGAALRFPILLQSTPNSSPVVRTILSIDEEKNSLTFAGDVPTGSTIRFMKANFDRIIDASATAAEQAVTRLTTTPELAILISCVGRKLVLGQRTEEEIEAAREIFGDETLISGFYSYGELAPSTSTKCELHNQTMTITTFAEN
ncbi:MAG: FIST signal transduction protein [Spirosomataceae bacterium]